MEGVQAARLGLVQIKSSEGQIYLVRTGINSRLYDRGRLRDLLEEPTVLKVWPLQLLETLFRKCA